MQEHQSFTYRTVTDASHLLQVVELQQVIWPQDTVTSLPQMATIRYGGTVIGAYDGPKLIGFNYGFPGVFHHEMILCSHMMGIHPDYRDLGIGMRLKLEQRVWSMQQGYRKMVWSFDPFQTRNAHLNVNKLGGTIDQYVPSLYGKDSAGFSTDRFIVQCDVLRSIRAIWGSNPIPGSIGTRTTPSFTVTSGEIKSSSQ